MNDGLQVCLARIPEGIPEVEDFSVVEQAMPAVADGEVLCEALWLSLDPYMRSQIAGRTCPAR